MEANSESVCIALRTLGSFFSTDPEIGRGADSLFVVLSGIDPEQVAADWPAADAEIQRLLADLAEGAAGDLGKLAREYRRLFTGPGRLPVPPYGSVYMDRDQVLFGDSTLALRSWMRRNCVSVEGRGVVPEDHIGTMLTLLAWLFENKPEVVDDYLENHLLTWCFHYFSLLGEESGESVFYRSLSQLASLTLAEIMRSRGLKAVEPRFYR